MKVSNLIIATGALLILLICPLHLQGQFIDAPSDMVINCDLDVDFDALNDINDRTFGRIRASAGERRIILTFDRLNPSWCTEYSAPDVVYNQKIDVAALACDYHGTYYDPTMPDRKFNLDWGFEGYTLDSDSVTVRIEREESCPIILIRRIFTAYQNGATALDTQLIYIHTAGSMPFVVNEKNIEDDTDCIDFNVLDTVFISDCSVDLTKSPSVIPINGPLYKLKCSFCLPSNNPSITFRDTVLNPTPLGYKMERKYTVVEWCSGESFTVADTFYVECLKSSISGNIYYDSLENCILNTLESGLNRWKVNAEGTNGFFSTFTDRNGDYSFALPMGDYTIEVIPPNTLWEPCPNQNNAVINIPDDSSQVTWDIGVQADTICSIPVVELELARFRRCRLTHIDVIYSNEGTKDMVDAEIVIELPDEITFIKSVLPSRDLGGNVYAISVGNLKSGEKRTERIEVRISCNDVQTGESLCVTANLGPQDSCQTSNSSSLIETSAECRNDSVILTIENQGEDMEMMQNYWIVEEDLIMFMKRYKLNNGEKVSEKYLANGRTYFIIAENEGSRKYEKVISGIEGCTEIDSTSFTTGMLAQFKFNSLIKTSTTKCQVVTGPYDPNDKTSSPLGLGDKKEIFRDQRIDYKIRFQNTGTDTAFLVIIRDTLDTNLDIKTIEFISSSHDVKFHLENNVLICHFFNIMLPDSNVNFLASNGYVSFSIKPISNLRGGTQIINDADIYFDFEDPILTNISLLQIFGEITTSQDGQFQELWNIDIHPNPMNDILYINNFHKEMAFGIIDVNGQVIKSGMLNMGSNNLTFKNIPQGVYSILFKDGNHVDVRKFVVQ